MSLAWCEWTYAALVACAIATIDFGGDRWGWATIVSYGPRLVVLLPAVLLLPWALWRRRGWVSAGSLVAALFFVLGFNVPWRQLESPTSKQAAPLRLLELNANVTDTDGLIYDPVRLDDLIARESPGVLALAEWDPATVPPTAASVPWNLRHDGDVTLASRFPILRTVTWSGQPSGGEGRAVGCELLIGERHVWCFAIHLETPRRGFEPVLHRLPNAGRTLAESIARRRMLTEQLAAFIRGVAGDGDVVIAGDFNELSDGAIYRAAWGRYGDAFDRAGWGPGWTKHQLHWGERIDHILAGVRWHAVRCHVCADVGSDHLPLFAELDRAD